MSIGLDLGSNQFRSLRRQGHRLMARACRTVYSVVQDNPARRTLFAERHVPFAEFGSNLILFGEAAEEWSTRLRVSTIPLVMHGRLQLDDRVIRQVLTALIEGLLPSPDGRMDDCCLTLPAGLYSTSGATMEFVTEVLRNCGYRSSFSTSSLAVGLSELSRFGMCGLGVYLGEARSEFSIIRQGRELSCFAIPSGIIPGSDTEGDVELKLRDIFAQAAYELNRRAETKALLPPVTLAISGEYAGIARIIEAIRSTLPHASWPFALAMPQISVDPAWCVGRGCLIQAELDQLTALARPAA